MSKAAVQKPKDLFLLEGIVLLSTKISPKLLSLKKIT